MSLANREKVVLPKLDWSYDALEPYISGQINEIHHSKHHQTYVNGYNKSIEELIESEIEGNVTRTVELQKNVNFFAGGHANHVLFWKSLSPTSQYGGQLPSSGSKFSQQVISQYGSFDKLIELVNGKLAGIQGSGWAFLVKNLDEGVLQVVTTANQDTVTGNLVPLIAIDAWEHAYYLQYQNAKLDYFKAIWNVINWTQAEQKYINL